VWHLASFVRAHGTVPIAQLTGLSHKKPFIEYNIYSSTVLLNGRKEGCSSLSSSLNALALGLAHDAAPAGAMGLHTLVVISKIN